MTAQTQLDIANRFYVSDIASALTPATRLSTIIARLDKKQSLTKSALNYLDSQNLLSLHQLASGLLSHEEFQAKATNEQTERKQAAKLQRLADEEKQRLLEIERKEKIKTTQEVAKAARIAREKDPKYIAKVKNQNLRSKYDLDWFIEPEDFPILMNILKRVDNGQRLSEKDIVWLTTEGDEYYTDKLRTRFHSIEAKFCTNQYKKTQDLWMLVNASSHYRKSNNSKLADQLFDAININEQKSPKLKAALLTTLGGVKRDIGMKSEAIALGEQAHQLVNKDYRPCTLIGAVHMETGNLMLGQEWYTKAEERGASTKAIDSDLRSIFMRADKASRSKMKAHLLRVDSTRYSWAKKF
ncbi:hypothetical protein ACMXYQ_15560 [Neptuniibacter sp. PT34_22]|uniref:hypothetical protein n=1 Tax=Neptuniibacter sp. PT34_22 TaxID=3398205 RepID=UPI0039F501D7